MTPSWECMWICWRTVPWTEVSCSVVACLPSIQLDRRLTSLLQLTVVQTPETFKKLFSPLLCPNTASLLDGKLCSCVNASGEIWHIHKLLGFTFVLIIKNIFKTFLGHAAHFPSVKQKILPLENVTDFRKNNWQPALISTLACQCAYYAWPRLIDTWISLWYNC